MESGNRKRVLDGDQLEACSSKKAKTPEIYKGILERVTLKNFMCHANLVFDLKPNINFIYGRNGSGKSAILTGIQLALCGRASSTSRSNSVVSFIKSGKTYAEISVTVQNKGAEAYKPGLYGDSITIERKIFSAGRSEYKIKSKTGKLVSTRCADIALITRHLGIQVDNPLNILTQEISRQFLTSKSNQEKYKFFNKATGLEKMFEDINSTVHYQTEYSLNLNKKRTRKELLEKELKVLDKKLSYFNRIRNQKDKCRTLSIHLDWALLTQQKNELTKIDNVLKDLHKDSELSKVSSQEYQDILDRFSASEAECSDKMQETQTALKEVEIKLEASRSSLVEKSNAYKAHKYNLERHRNDLSNMEKELSYLQQHIDKAKMEIQKATDEVRRKREEEMAKKEELKQSIMSKQRTSEVHRDNISTTIYHIRNKMEEVNRDGRNITAELRETESKVRELKDSLGNKLKRFGQFTPTLHSKINEYFRKGRFTKKPIGPLGIYLTLKDRSWATGVEQCLKSLLRSYCVHNDKDRVTLQSLIDQVCRGAKPPIIVSPFPREIYQDLKTPQNTPHPTVLEMLTISEPVVANCLIDQAGIEATLLVEENETARRLMCNSATVPPGCYVVYTKSGDQVFPAPQFRYYSNSRGPGYLLANDIQPQINKCEQEISRLKGELEHIHELKQDISKELEANQSSLHQENGVIFKCQQEIELLKTEISLLNTMASQEKKVNSSLSMLEKNQEEKTSAFEARKLEVEPMIVEDADLLDQVRSVQDEIKDLNALQQKHHLEFLKLKQKITTIRDQVQENKARKLSSENQKIDIEAQIKTHTSEFSLKQSSFSKTRDEILEKHGGVEDIQRSPESIKNEIDTIRGQIKLEENVDKTEEEVRELHEKKSQELTAANEIIIEFSDHLKNLESTVIKRRSDFMDIRAKTIQTINRHFTNLLISQNHNGALTFDHEKKTLDIKVKMNASNHRLKEGDLKALSGGERSFTTVALFLALWDAIDAPFRILDEYDVYMDPINRQFSTTMLLDTAFSKPKNQFIFLTPQPIQDLPDSDMIHIYKMKNPRPNAGQQEEEESCE